MGDRYKMDDGTVVDTDRATQSWDEATHFNGSNQISVATGSQWEHERLHRSAKGRYWLESWSQRQGVGSSARFVTKEEAAAWLLANDESVPEDLESAAAKVAE